MDTAEIVRAFVARMEARERDAFGALLAPDVVYEIPQTRKRIRGRENYVRFNAEYPGEWHIEPQVVLGTTTTAHCSSAGGWTVRSRRRSPSSQWPAV